MELLLLLAIGFLIRGSLEHSKGDRARSRDQKVKEVAKTFPKDALPKSRQRSAARQHAMGWWTREVRHGFPVHRTGWHAAWLAHQTTADHHKARREEAKTTALETRASVLKGMPEHKQRQEAAQKELDAIEAELAAQQAKGSPATGKRAVREAADEVAARREKRRPTGGKCPGCGAPDGYPCLKGCDPSVPPLPADSVPRQRDDLAEHVKAPMPDPRLSSAQRQRDQRGQRNLCAACGHPGNPDDELVISDGYRVHESHTHDPASGFYEGTPPEAAEPGSDAARNPEPINPTASPTTQGAPVTDTNYDVVMENAKKRADEAEQDAVAASQRHQAAMAHAEDMQAVGVKGTTLSAQMELMELLKQGEEHHKKITEQAVAVRDALAKEHGGIKGAVDDAPVEPAEMPFYQGS